MLRIVSAEMPLHAEGGLGGWQNPIFGSSCEYCLCTKLEQERVDSFSTKGHVYLALLFIQHSELYGRRQHRMMLPLVIVAVATCWIRAPV